MMGLGVQEMVIVGIVAIVLFGKRLPEVARSLGKTYNEFRKGLAEFQSTVDYSSTYTPPKSTRSRTYDDYDEPTAPRFEPPPAAPAESAGASETPPTGEIAKPVSEK